MQLQRHLADFIKKYGATVSQLEASYLPGIGAGKCTPFPPEQLTFHQGSWQCRTVYRYQGQVLARTAAVDGARDHALARAGFAKKQNGRIHWRHLFDPHEYVGNGRAVTNNFAEIVLSGNLLLQVDVLGLEPVFQELDFRIRTLQRLFRPCALPDFLGELQVCPGKFTSPVLYSLFQHLVVLLDLPVQQPHFQDVVDSCRYLDQINRFADEILCARFECPQLVTRLGGNHNDRNVAAGFD